MSDAAVNGRLAVVKYKYFTTAEHRTEGCYDNGAATNAHLGVVDVFAQKSRGEDYTKTEMALNAAARRNHKKVIACLLAVSLTEELKLVLMSRFARIDGEYLLS